MLRSIAIKIFVLFGISSVLIVYYKFTRKAFGEYSKLKIPFLANKSESQQFYTWRNENACKTKKSFGGKWKKSGKFASKFKTKMFYDGNKTLCLDQDVMPDPQEKCLIYSFGISTDWSFEEAMEEYGCKVFAFDPSIGLKPFKYSENIYFYDFGLGKADDLHHQAGWKLRTLGTLVRKFGHTSNVIDVLKIDIEGTEYEVLLEMLESGVLMNVKQIAMEVHNLYDIYYGAFWLLEQSFLRFESIPNIACSYINATVIQHYCFEISWLNIRFRNTEFETRPWFCKFF